MFTFNTSESHKNNALRKKWNAVLSIQYAIYIKLVNMQNNIIYCLWVLTYYLEK